MTGLIPASLALAVLLFTLSLPLRGFALGVALRKWAQFFLLAALVPSVAISACRTVVGSSGDFSLTSLLAAVGLLALISTAAYLTLAAKGLVGPTTRGDDRGKRRGYHHGDDREDD